MRINVCSGWLLSSFHIQWRCLLVLCFAHSLWPTAFRWAVNHGLAFNFGNTVLPAPTEQYPRRTRFCILFYASGLGLSSWSITVACCLCRYCSYFEALRCIRAGWAWGFGVSLLFTDTLRGISHLPDLTHLYGGGFEHGLLVHTSLQKGWLTLHVFLYDNAFILVSRIGRGCRPVLCGLIPS